MLSIPVRCKNHRMLPERLQFGQRAEDIFAYLFAKQQTVIAR